MQAADGRIVDLHRTYLQDGTKVAGRPARKRLLGGHGGAAVRLEQATDTLGVCEGIENGLSVAIATGMPMWCGITAGNLEKLWLPDTVQRIRIYGDNDADAMYDGQASAYILARRLRKTARHGGPPSVDVFIPRHAGDDWNTVRVRQVSAIGCAA